LRGLGRAEYRRRIEAESGNNGDDGLIGRVTLSEEVRTIAVMRKRRWSWPRKRRAEERALMEELLGLWKKRALNAERHVDRERREREAIERVEVKEVLREKVDLLRIEALEAELEEYRRNPG